MAIGAEVPVMTVPPPPVTFSYHRAVAPLLWIFVAVASVELVTVHLLVALLWSRAAAAILSLLTLGSILWLVSVILSMRRLPVVLAEGMLTMRVGTLKGAVVPLASIAGLRGHWDAAVLKDRSVLNLALIAWPNVVVDLKLPLPGRRGVRSIAHRLDDPAAFAAALERLVGGA